MSWYERLSVPVTTPPSPRLALSSRKVSRITTLKTRLQDLVTRRLLLTAAQRRSSALRLLESFRVSYLDLTGPYLYPTLSAIFDDSVDLESVIRSLAYSQIAKRAVKSMNCSRYIKS